MAGLFGDSSYCFAPPYKWRDVGKRLIALFSEIAHTHTTLRHKLQCVYVKMYFPYTLLSRIKYFAMKCSCRWFQLFQYWFFGFASVNLMVVESFPVWGRIVSEVHVPCFYLLACQVIVTVDESGLCCCVPCYLYDWRLSNAVNSLWLSRSFFQAN